MPENAVNVYKCDRCRGEIVTIDREEGTTPFMLECKATPGCEGIMRSAFYLTSGNQRPEWEWYKPASLKGLDDWTREHVEKGGLVLQRIPANDRGIADPKLRQVIAFIEGLEVVSAITLQRQFRITYMMAAAMVDQLIQRRFIEQKKDRMGKHMVIKREASSA